MYFRLEEISKRKKSYKKNEVFKINNTNVRSKSIE